MFGHNPKLPAENSDGSVLKITSIFATFQGEGPYVGQSCVFIRLSGCNLACSFCDTDFDDYIEMPVDAIVEKIRLAWCSFTSRLSSMPPLVVVTGGEPLRQNIDKLCRILIEQGVIIQIETNGTIWRPIPPQVQVVCSPNVIVGKYYQIRDDILQQTIAIKFLVSTYQSGYEDISDVGQEQYRIPVYIQPMDHYDHAKNTANMELAMRLAAKYNARISVQLHKIIGIE